MKVIQTNFVAPVRDLSEKLMLTLKDTCNWTEMCEMSYEQGSNLSVRTLSPCLVSHQDVSGLSQPIPHHTAFRITSASSSTIRAAPWLIWNPAASCSYQRAPSIPLMRHHPLTSWSLAIEDISRILLYKTVSLNGHICHICKEKSSNFQTFLETSMDFSWFFVPNCGTLPVKNPCEFI